MAKRKAPPPEPDILVAKIEAIEQTYYISEYPNHQSPVGDEARIDILARIERISPSLKRFLGLPINIAFAIERSFDQQGRTPPTDRPFLLPMNLRKNSCSCMATSRRMPSGRSPP